MASKTIYTCDRCGGQYNSSEINHLSFLNIEIDLCDECDNKITKHCKVLLSKLFKEEI